MVGWLMRVFSFFFEVTLQFELRSIFRLVNEDFSNQRIIIILLVLVVGVEYLELLSMYCIGFVIISVDFAGILDVLGLPTISIFLCLIVIQSMGVFGPGGDVNLDAK